MRREKVLKSIFKSYLTITYLKHRKKIKRYKKNEAKNSSLIEKINLRKGNIISHSLVVGGSFHFRVKSI